MELLPFSLTGKSLENYFITISTRSRIIYWIIIGTVVTFISVLPFIYVDVSVQARGYFQSDLEKQVIYAPFHGKVIYSSLKNGKRINKGDTLIIIDSEWARAGREALMKRLTENNESMSDLTELIMSDISQDQSLITNLLTSRYKAEYDKLRSHYALQRQKYMKRSTEHERNTLLYRQEIIPEIDFENSQYLLDSEKDNLEQIVLSQKSVWQNDLAVRRIEAVNLEVELEQCTEELSNRIVLATIGGEVIKSSDIQSGTVVSQGQVIAEISPDGELVATCFVRPADIGLINEDHEVKIQVDAFNYNEWGMIKGSIADISDDMIIENGSMAYFRIKCRPDQDYLTLKNGKKAYIKKGMSLNARIVVVRRTLFNLLFDKADKWFNPYTYTRE